MEDIRNAINAGKTVTTHQSNISYKGWNGSGYIILDPTTGTGAYLIDGGANGARLIIFGSIILASVIAILAEVAVVGFAGSVAVGGLGLGVAVGHVVSLIMLGLGAIIAGDALYYQRSEAQCKFGFGLMTGGALASGASIATVAQTGTLGETAMFFVLLLEHLGIRGAGYGGGYLLSDGICKGVYEDRI